MINPTDSIKYRNVVSRKYIFHANDIEQAFKEFLEDVAQTQADIKGPLFYSINNVPTEKLVKAEFFIPVRDEKIELEEDMLFHSYFEISGMISNYLFFEFEKTAEIGYARLFDYMEENRLRQVTPIFHILSGDKSFQYVKIAIGVASEEMLVN